MELILKVNLQITNEDTRDGVDINISPLNNPLIWSFFAEGNKLGTGLKRYFRLVVINVRDVLFNNVYMFARKGQWRWPRGLTEYCSYLIEESSTNADDAFMRTEARDDLFTHVINANQQRHDRPLIPPIRIQLAHGPLSLVIRVKVVVGVEPVFVSEQEQVVKWSVLRLVHIGSKVTNVCYSTLEVV